MKNYFDFDNYTPEAFNELIENGMPVNRRDAFGNTPLFYAVDITTNPPAGILEDLLDAGIDVDIKNNNGASAIHQCRDVETLMMLVDYGADIHATNSTGKNILHFTNDVEIIEYALEQGVDPNARMNNGNTPLFNRDDENIVNALLEGKANPNALNNHKQNALHTSKSAEVTEVLLGAGADPYAKDLDGRLPYETCSEDSKPLLKEAFDNQKQKERILEEVNEEQPFERKQTQRRRRM